jgi:hypothetical protein
MLIGDQADGQPPPDGREGTPLKRNTVGVPRRCEIPPVSADNEATVRAHLIGDHGRTRRGPGRLPGGLLRLGGRLDLCWLGRFCRLWCGHDFGQQLCCELVQTIGIVEEFSEC